MSFLSGKRFLSLAALAFSALLLISFLSRAHNSAAIPTAVVPDGRTVILDAGHGGQDAGAIGVNGALEKDLNLSVTLLLAERLRAAGVRVILTRETDEMVLSEAEKKATGRKAKDLANRLAVAKAYPDALFVSIHMNSFPVGKYKGFEVYYAADGTSRLLAESMMGKVKETLIPDNTRTAKAAGESIYLLYNAVTPAVLVECGFLSNGEDAAKLSDKDYQKQLSFCLFCAIMEVEI